MVTYITTVLIVAKSVKHVMLFCHNVAALSNVMKAGVQNSISSPTSVFLRFTKVTLFKNDSVVVDIESILLTTFSFHFTRIRR